MEWRGEGRSYRRKKDLLSAGYMAWNLITIITELMYQEYDSPLIYQNLVLLIPIIPHNF